MYFLRFWSFSWKKVFKSKFIAQTCAGKSIKSSQKATTLRWLTLNLVLFLEIFMHTKMLNHLLYFDCTFFIEPSKLLSTQFGRSHLSSARTKISNFQLILVILIRTQFFRDWKLWCRKKLIISGLKHLEIKM